MIQMIDSSIVLFFASNTSPKLYILVVLIHHINLQFLSQKYLLPPFTCHSFDTQRRNWHDFDPILWLYQLTLKWFQLTIEKKKRYFDFLGRTIEIKILMQYMQSGYYTAI